MEFVAFVGKDKENWGQVSALIKKIDGERIIIVRDKETKGFALNERCEEIIVNCNNALVELKDEMMSKLRQKTEGDFEVLLSIASGGGKEHMALISALLSLPVGIKLVVFTKDGINYIN
jgi:hypothetical protein